MEQKRILDILNQYYEISFDKCEFIRDSGCIAYAVYAKENKYFLRITKPMFYDTTLKSLDIHLFLQKENFSVPRIIFTKDEKPYVNMNGVEGKVFYVLYEFVEGEEVDPEQDAELIGAFVGRLHRVMKKYPGHLVKNDKYFYVDRYINILRAKQYDKVDEFIAYGEFIWEKVKNLSYGYCHGDMYRGNILKTSDGRMYILDFDTSCEGFLMYDPALICNITDYFDLESDGCIKTKAVYERFLVEYLKYVDLTDLDKNAIYDLIALYHFALQATIIELFGPNCVDNILFDSQLAWLNNWKEQCAKEGVSGWRM